MKTELEKMRSEELYSFADPEVYASYMQADRACQRLNATCLSDADYRPALEALLPGIPVSAMVVPPFYCDHAHGITLGEHVFINRQVTMLNSGRITIGPRSVIGAGSVVVEDIPADTLAVGNPCRPLRKLR